jgi:hypothetical protein
MRMRRRRRDGEREKRMYKKYDWLGGRIGGCKQEIIRRDAKRKEMRRGEEMYK